ncbi:MAG: ferrous iron transport protein A [Aeromonadaceae bacterium]|jgi:Fe2+ transport system protein A|nr:ferrous iron transport protein A [Aeromonadaceae bacterium]
MQLSEIKPGETVRITSLSGVEPVVRRKLMAMGLLPCSQVRFVRSAPLGDPMQISADGITLSVQKELASKIEVTAL